MRVTAIILYLISSFTFEIYSQDISNRTIEVIGSHEMEIEPNEIYLEIEIKEENNGRDKVTLNEKENFLKNGLKEIGIDLSKLKIKNSYGRSYRIKRKEEDLLIEKKYSLEVNDIKIFNKLLERASDLGIESIEINRKDHSDIEKYEIETKREAIRKGKLKATMFLEELSETLGRLITLKELETQHINFNEQPYLPQLIYEEYKFRSWSDKSKQGTISIEKIKLIYNIYLKFEIK